MSRDAVSWEVEGFEEFDAALQELPRATGKNVLRRAGTQALELMRAEAVRLAPDDPLTPAPKNLKTSIEIGERRSTGRFGGAADRLGDFVIRLWMGPTKDGYPQAMPQEFGAAPHYVSKNAGRKRVRATLDGTGRKMHPGNPPHPFMRPAFDRMARAVLDAVFVLIWIEIEKAVDRIQRKLARRGVPPTE